MLSKVILDRKIIRKFTFRRANVLYVKYNKELNTAFYRTDLMKKYKPIDIKEVMAL